MIFRDTAQTYDPQKAMQETLEKYGEDVFQISNWEARRLNAQPSNQMHNDGV